MIGMTLTATGRAGIAHRRLHQPPYEILSFLFNSRRNSLSPGELGLAGAAFRFRIVCVTAWRVYVHLEYGP